MLARTMLALILGLAVLADVRAADAPQPAPPAPTAQPAPAADAIEVVVENGYHPARIVAKEGRRVELTFLRKEYTGCTLEVVFPTLGIRKSLPTNEPVTIDLGTPPAGEIPFHCGMNMIHGVVVVEPEEQP